MAPQPPRFRPSLPQALAVLAGVVLFVAYPFAVEAAKAAFGIRVVAGALFVLGLGSLALDRAVFAGSRRFAIAVRLALLALLAAATIAGAALPLLLIPSLVYAVLAAAFVASLRDGSSAIGRAARLMHPHVPDFVDPYCRKVTMLWALLFAANAIAIAALARFAPALWASWTGGYVYLAMGAVSLIEFAVRKAWFRYYGDGPLDRVLSALLPPENTWQGRRSKAYVLRMRRELGMKPPPG